MRAFIRDTIVTFIIAAVMYFGLHATIQSYIIRESSMEPNFYEGQRVLVNKFIYKFHEPERGDVVILQPPLPYDPSATPFIKRIIALPGDTVEVKNGVVYVNDSKLNEPYIKEPANYTFRRETISGGYFVLGDNRTISNDSHTGWILPRQNIIGKAWLSIWPLARFGLVDNHLQLEQIGNLTNNR